MESLAEIIGRLLPKFLRLEGPVVTLLARILVIVGTLILTVIAYRFLGRLIERLLRPLEGATDYPQKVQRARTREPKKRFYLVEERRGGIQ